MFDNDEMIEIVDDEFGDTYFYEVSTGWWALKRAELTLEQAIKIATHRILPAGFKPEDYFCVNESIPIRLATLIIKDAIHLVKISQH